MIRTNERGAEHLAEVIKFAAKTDQLSQLLTMLHRLDNYAEPERMFDRKKDEWPKTICHLGWDFAPYSFAFSLELLQEEESAFRGEPVYKPWFHGGLIYHGSHDGGGNGSAPSFSVSLTPSSGWSIHT
jgi:hypothetical protein